MERNLTKWIEKSIDDDSIVAFEPDKIDIKEELGAGAFSKVHKALLKVGVNPITVAVKIFKNSSELQVDEKMQNDLIKEIKLLRTVGFHDNILSFHGISKVPDTETYMLILEYADGGSLRKYLKSRELSGSEKIRLAKEIVSGVACLHDSDIIHRDLNSANILIHQDQIKIADLGLSKKAGADTLQKEASKVHGHLQYIDPQCFRNINYNRTRKSDIYSIGVVFWELSSRRIPFPELSSTQAIAYIINGVREDPVAGTPQEFIDLYTKCWDQEPENRPEISEVYEALGEIEWETEATPTKTVSSEDQQDVDTSTTISQKLSDIELVKSKGIPEEATVLLKQFFDSGKEADDIRGYIYDYLREKEKKPNELFKMLTDESSPDGDVKKHPHALLFGFCYYKEIGIEMNRSRAFDIFRKLADEEDPKPNYYARYFLGECYRSGFGVGVDRVKAFHWYEKSAEGGTSNGQYELADCYRYGFGIEKDIKEAKLWYRKAADKKHFLALNALNDETWQTEK